MIAWSSPIWIYLWLAGMAGGAYFAAFLAERFAGTTSRQLLRLGTYLGIPLAIVGVILLIVDLGQPIRFWHLLARFEVSSPMSMGTWILIVWVIVAIVMVIFWWVENFLSAEIVYRLRQINELLSWIGVVFAVLLMTYTGVLLSVSSQPLWAGSIFLPSLFVASAVSTGVAILILTAIVTTTVSKGSFAELKVAVNQLFGGEDWVIPNRTIGRLAEADAVVILIELALLIVYAISLGASTVAGTGDALRLLTTGTLAAPFWLGIILLALLIPLGLDLTSWGKKLEIKSVWRAVVLSSACVILGGLVLRAVVVLGGQI